MSVLGLLHGYTTTPGMLTVICSAVGAALAGVLLMLLAAPTIPVAVGAAIVLVLGVVIGTIVTARSIGGSMVSLRPRFPTPTHPPGGPR